MAIHLTLITSVRGHAYDEHLTLPPAAAAMACKGLPDGLRFDPERRLLHGIPTLAGQFSLTFHAADGSLIAMATLIVHEGTQAMWEALDPPADAPCPTTHTASARIEGESVAAYAASKRGRQHARMAAFREDAYAMARSGAWTLLAVADGAGSCSMSREGAKVAAQSALQHLSGLPAALDPNTALPAAFEAACNALAARADAMGLPAKELSTTLSLLCHHHGPEGHTFAALGIGDCPVLLLDAEGQPHVLHQPDEGDFSGETHFLPAPPPPGLLAALESRVQVRRLPSFRAAFVLSDGIHDPFFETQRGLRSPERWAAFLESLAPALEAQPAERAEALLAWLDFWSRGNHDDRTLIILQPHEPH